MGADRKEPGRKIVGTWDKHYCPNYRELLRKRANSTDSGLSRTKTWHPTIATPMRARHHRRAATTTCFSNFTLLLSIVVPPSD